MSTNHSRILPGKLNAIESQPTRVQMRMKRQVLEVLSTAVDLTKNSGSPVTKTTMQPSATEKLATNFLNCLSEITQNQALCWVVGE